MRTIERTDAEALSWPVGSQHEIDGQMFIVTVVRDSPPFSKVHLAERDEWLLRSCVSPWAKVSLGSLTITPQVGTSCADFLGQIRQAMLRELGVK
jgi:hypothetical protein